MTPPKKPLTHNEVIDKILYTELKSFIERMEKKYGKEFIEKNFGLMAIAMEEDPTGGMFRTSLTASNLNTFRIAHACIRSLQKITEQKHLERGVVLPPIEACKAVMNIIWEEICGDLGQEGVPESIFKGVIMNQQDNSPPTNDLPGR